MKKVKSNELKENESLLKHINDGKIQENKLKKANKLKDAVTETGDLDLAPKKITSNKKAKKKNGEISTNLEQNQQFKHKNKKVANNLSKIGRQREEIKSKPSEESFQTETSSSELEKVDVKKIKKGNAKKLKKKENAKNKNNLKKPIAANINGGENDEKLDQKYKKEKAKNKDNLNKIVAANINGVQNDRKMDTSVIKSSDFSDKVLAKKEKKAEKRKLIKAQKLAEKQTRGPAVEASTVFVGNLPVNTKRVQLVRLFKDYVPINYIRIRSAGGKVIFKHKTRKAAGSLNAYVVFKDKETAEKAVSLNGVEFKGNHLRITSATKSCPSDEKEENKRTVFVGNLKYSATEESLREIFSSCGDINYVRCLRDGDKGCKGVAYVCFKTSDAVGLALELNKTIVDERPINVERYSIKKLGAKEAREALAENEKKSKMGPKQRIEGKKLKNENLKHMHKTNNRGEADDDKKPKKSEFRGVKIEGLKKKQKSKKKKSNDQMMQLAKKIAPKIKTG